MTNNKGKDQASLRNIVCTRKQCFFLKFMNQSELWSPVLFILVLSKYVWHTPCHSPIAKALSLLAVAPVLQTVTHTSIDCCVY